MKFIDFKNGHICLDCALKANFALNSPCKVIQNKCVKCKKIKTGVSKKSYKEIQ